MTVHVFGPPDEDDLKEPEEALCEVDRSFPPDARVVYHYRFRVTHDGHFVCVICGETDAPPPKEPNA